MSLRQSRLNSRKRSRSNSRKRSRSNSRKRSQSNSRKRSRLNSRKRSRSNSRKRSSGSVSSDFSPLLSFARSKESPDFFYNVIKNDNTYELYIRYAIEYICKVLFKERTDFKIILSDDKLNFSVIQITCSSETECSTQFHNFSMIMDNMHDEHVQLILLPLSIFKQQEEIGHQNLLVIDKLRQTIEFYDPSGADYHHTEYGKIVINIVMNKLSTYSEFQNYTVMEYEKTCPVHGLQYYEDKKPYSPRDYPGYCVIWTLFLMHLRIKYYKKDPMRVHSHYLHQLTRDKTMVAPQISSLNSWLTKELKIADKFRIFLKKYSTFIFKQMEQHIYEEYEHSTSQFRTRTRYKTPRIQELESRIDLFRKTKTK